MARITHVKAAQQRYEMVPVLNEDGTPKVVPVMKGDTQKVTKRGTPVTMTITVADKTKPLPPETCDYCREPIEVGSAYMWVMPKSGPYGGSKRSRHESCPTWKPWDLSSAWWARIAQATADFDVSSAETPDDVTSALEEVAQAIRDLAAESEEAADNIESGFGHETMVSEEARSRAEALEGWADEIEAVDVPDLPDPEEQDCENCEGTGEVESTEEGNWVSGPPMVKCSECDGTGQVTPDEPTEDQMQDWLAEVEDACAIVQESPV